MHAFYTLSRRHAQIWLDQSERRSRLTGYFFKAGSRLRVDSPAESCPYLGIQASEHSALRQSLLSHSPTVSESRRAIFLRLPPSLHPSLPIMSQHCAEVFQISLGNGVRLTVRVGSEDGRVQAMTCDLRHYVSDKAQARGVTFSMAELETLAKMAAIVSGSGRFFLPSADRALRVLPNGEFSLFVVERPGVRRHIKLHSSQLPSLLSSIPAAIFVMKNYGRRSADLATTAAFCLLLLEDEGGFKRSMARICLALGVPRDLHIPRSKAAAIGTPSRNGVELSTLHVFSSLANNELIHY